VSVERERGDGQVGAGAVAGGDVAEHACGEIGHVPGGRRRVLQGQRRTDRLHHVSHVVLR